MSNLISVEVPTVGESITEVQIGQWLKNEGDAVTEGEDLVEIETEKASVQVPAPASGTLASIQVASDEFANVGDIIASIDPSGAGSSSSSGGSSASGGNSQDSNSQSSGSQDSTPSAPSRGGASDAQSSQRDVIVMPAAQRLLQEHGLSADAVKATGPGNRLLKEDVQAHLDSQPKQPAASPPPANAAPVNTPPANTPHARLPLPHPPRDRPLRSSPTRLRIEWRR